MEFCNYYPTGFNHNLNKGGQVHSGYLSKGWIVTCCLSFSFAIIHVVHVQVNVCDSCNVHCASSPSYISAGKPVLGTHRYKQALQTTGTDLL